MYTTGVHTLAENQFFRPTESEMGILRAHPPTEESLSLATRMGLRIGRLAVTDSDLFENNLRVSLRNLQQRELHHIPSETFAVFENAAFKAQTYVAAYIDIADTYGRPALNYLDISVHYRLATSQLPDQDI